MLGSMFMYARYAIFYTPAPGSDLAVFGARWLGWDSAKGRTVAHPFAHGLDVQTITKTPRRYGFHATLKAPFHPAAGLIESDLIACVTDFAAAARVAPLNGLVQGYRSGFVALRPAGDTSEINTLAETIVRELDMMRAPLSEADIARRRRAGLTAKQDAQMLDWGYPYIFDDFQFHMTLSGPLDEETANRVIDSIAPHAARAIPDPLSMDAITLMGEDAAGQFHQIRRCSLTG